MWTSFLFAVCLSSAWAFWDKATTTLGIIRTDVIPRQSFFRWQRAEPESMRFWAPYFDWNDQSMRKKLFVICGLSIDFLPITTGALMNRRTVISSANPLDPYMHRQRDLRIWALGRGGGHNMPYRYRVWRVRRILPRSSNPEHAHGPRGRHVPRHDVTVIHSMDQMYIYFKHPWQTHYAYRTLLCSKHQILDEDLFFAGSGYEYLEHIMENYKIFYAMTKREYVVDCSRYLPKWWGKFICIKNTINVAGVPNGGSLFINKGFKYGIDDILVGVGSFEIRYNEERIMAFTDLRYYVDLIYQLANITPGQYYEFAYPQWSVVVTWISDGAGNRPYIPAWQIFDDLFPLGRYRVWRVRRILPRSSNPEHAHGPRGRHVPRHDVTVIHSMVQMYIYFKHPWQTHYAYRTLLCSKHQILDEDLFFAGSGYEYLEHIMENYKIFYAMTKREYVVDCSRYLPKWWGKFICIKNTINVAGVPNGGSLFINKGFKYGIDDILVGVGSFEIRYNEERIMAFTDLRYYVDLIYQLANITPGQYYEFAYPQWSVVVTWIYDGAGNRPYILAWQIFDDLFPLGR